MASAESPVAGSNAYRLRDWFNRILSVLPPTTVLPKIPLIRGDRTDRIHSFGELSVIDDYPNDADGQSLRRVRDCGSDMSKPMEIDFHIAVPDQQAAERVAQAARQLGYTPSIYSSEECSLPWTCQCSRIMVASYKNIVHSQAELLVVAEPFGGFPDGWGTFGNVNTHR